MADDITLTVRVRDLTRGDFERMRQRMRGMDGDVRHLARSSGLASDRADRLSQSIRGVSGRMTQLSRTGSAAGHEMSFIRRTMGLLGRDLRNAARAGELTEDQFRSLRDELERTRLDFDYLDRDIRRHSAVAQDAHRAEMARQRRASTAARQQQRDERGEARRQQADLRRQLDEQRREMDRFRRSTGDAGMTVRLRTVGDQNFTRLTASLNRMRDGMRGIAGSSDDARNSVDLFGRDLNVMSRMLQDARSSGSMTRRELNSLSNGLTLLSRNARGLVRSGDMTRSTFRSMSRDIAQVRAQLTLLGGDSRFGDRLNARMLLFQHRMRDVDSGAGRLRRSFSRMGDWGAGGMRGGLVGMLAMLGVMRRLGSAINLNSRWTAILVAVLLLLGPAAQALGALLVTALGGAFIALGAFALRGTEEVKGAFQGMKSTVGTVVREAAAPIKDSLVAGITQVGVAARQMQPMLTAAFAAAAPLVEDMFGGITDLFASALPGFTAALQNSGAAMEGFRAAMGLIGRGFGQMFEIITSGNEEKLAQAWVRLGEEIRNVLHTIGDFISTALNSGTASMLLIGFFRALAGVLNFVGGMLKAVDSLTGNLFQHIADGVTHVAAITGNTDKLGDSFGYAGKSAAELRVELARVNKGIEDIDKARSLIAGPAKHTVDEKEYNDLIARQAVLKTALSLSSDQVIKKNKEEAQSIADIIKNMRDLNELNRGSMDARAALEQAIDDATKGQGKYSKALSMTNGQLNLGSQTARDAYDLLSKLAGATNAATQEATDAHAPWQDIQALWQNGRNNLIAVADGMNLTSTEAGLLADKLINMPDAKVSFQMLTEEAKNQLNAFNGEVARSPGTKEVHLKTISATAEKILTSFGYKVTHLPDGSVTVTAIHGQALAGIANVAAHLSGLRDKKVTLTVERVNKITTYSEAIFLSKQQASGHADGNILTYRHGGENHTAQISRGTMRLWSEPETQGEAYIPLAESKRTRSASILADVAGRFGYRLEKFAGGGIADIIGGMSISPLWKQAGAKMSSFRKGLATPESMSSLISTISEWRNKIKNATSGSVEKRLVNTMARTAAFLIKHQIALTKVNGALDKAKSKLTDLKDKAHQLSENIKSGIIASGNITGGVESGKPASAANIMLKLQTSQRRATEFASMLAALKARGLGGQAISEIAQAGIEGGGFETAKALMKAAPDTLEQINQAQKQIAEAAAAAGKTTADAMYGAGIKAAEGLVAGLKKQQAKIVASMLNATVALEKAIKRALGRKGAGGIVGGAAAAGGPRSRRTLVGEYGPEIVDLAAGSMVRSNPDSRRIAGRWGSAGNRPIEVVVNLDGRTVARQIVDPLRAEIWDRSGGNVQKALGR